jgi:sugar phosphate isomerase/epimerase
MTNRQFPLGATSMMFWFGTVEQAVPLAAGMGFDALEIWAEHLWRGDEKPATVRQALAGHGMRCTVHCPIMDVNITSPNRGIRAESLRQMLTAVDLTGELDATLLVMHPGALFSRHDSLDLYWSVQLDAFEHMMDRARQSGVRLAVENMDVQNAKEVVKTPDDIRRITGHFPAGELGVVLDTTHLGATQRVLDFIAGAEGIVHTHFSDARQDASGKISLHLAMGEGELDFPRILAALLPRYEGILSLETFIASGNNAKIQAQRQRMDNYVQACLPAPGGAPGSGGRRLPPLPAACPSRLS